MLGTDVLPNLCTGDVPNVAQALVELCDFFGIGVEADDAMSSFGEAQSQRQANVTASDNSDLQF